MADAELEEVSGKRFISWLKPISDAHRLNRSDALVLRSSSSKVVVPPEPVLLVRMADRRSRGSEY